MDAQECLDMLHAMWDLLLGRWEFFGELLVEHLAISAAAIVIAIVAGGVFGLLIAERPRAAKPTLGVVNFLYTIPSISMLGFLIPFSGVGNATAVIALTIYALLPMVRNTYTGITNVDPALVEAACGMGSTDGQILRRIKIPLALPYIMSGIRSMATMTVALAGIASFIGAGGLGVSIYRGITTNNVAMTMDGSLLTALLALAVDVVLGFVERRSQMRSASARRANRRMALAAAGMAAVAALVAGVQAFVPAEVIHVATKPMTEQYIMGYMLKDLIEQDTDLTVELTVGVGGGTSNIEPAMESGEFDLYPEYTGTAWSAVLNKGDTYSEDLFGQLRQAYEDQLGLEWVGMYGFNNTFGLVVRREVAERYDLRTYSDLQRVASQLSFGAEYDFFEREDGYQALCDAYGLDFGSTMDLDIGLKYQALAEGQIDVMVIFTTDGQLSATDAVVLEDDKGLFPSYLCGNVVRRETLESHPELRAVLERLEGTVTDDDMAKMNYSVETEGHAPEDVAREYLEQKGLLR